MVVKGEELADVFLTAVPGRERFETLADLDARLRTLAVEAAGAWPGFSLDHGRFVRRLAETMPEEGDPGALLGRVHAADLYLAAACGIGEGTALRAFQDHYLPAAAAVLARFKDDGDFRAEALQELRVRLFTPGSARIDDYDGRGSLEGFLRIAAVRVGLNLLEKYAKYIPVAEPPEARIADAADPELDILRTRYRAEFTGALREAFAALPTEARRILRFYLLDRLNIAEIGTLIGASRTTIGRRVVECRRLLLEGTRERLRHRLGGASTAEIDSVLKLAGSRFDLTLSRVLASGAE